jgi:hypothetical protein
MAHQLTEADARQSLTAHVAERGATVRLIYGPHIGWSELPRILQDRTTVRYPCKLVFDDGPLLPGECAHVMPCSERPEHGFTVCIHPFFAARPADLPALVLYQLVLVNYGEFASSDDAETFGAAVLGLSRDEYYHWLCDLSDELRAHVAAS